MLEQYNAYSISVSGMKFLFSSGNPIKWSGWTLFEHRVYDHLYTLLLSMVGTKNVAWIFSTVFFFFSERWSVNQRSEKLYLEKKNHCSENLSSHCDCKRRQFVFTYTYVIHIFHISSIFQRIFFSALYWWGPEVRNNCLQLKMWKLR